MIRLASGKENLQNSTLSNNNRNSPPLKKYYLIQIILINLLRDLFSQIVNVASTSLFQNLIRNGLFPQFTSFFSISCKYLLKSYIGQLQHPLNLAKLKLVISLYNEKLVLSKESLKSYNSYNTLSKYTLLVDIQKLLCPLNST